jgi:5'-nucleotidase
LVVAGPNFGTNLEPFYYTLSGTAGYTYSSTGRGIPAIAFSGNNSEQRSYQWMNTTTASGYPDPATIQAQLAVNLVNTLVNNTRPGQPLLPQGYGISVNTPNITTLTNGTCINPPFIQTRLNGVAVSDKAVFNATSGLFTYADIVPEKGLNTYINGDFNLPGETAILNSGCMSSVSVFTVDYDAPIGDAQSEIRSHLSSLVQYQKSTSNGTATYNRSHPGGPHAEWH